MSANRIFSLLVLCSFVLPLSAKQAHINLSEAEWGLGNIYALAGEWDFAWHALLEPDSASDFPHWGRVTVPGPWTNSDVHEGAVSAEGYGTLRLKVTVPPNISTFYLAMPDMASAYRMWVNGVEVAGNGQVATTAELERAAYLPKVITVQNAPETLSILIQSSNFHYQWGGLWYAPRLTDDSGVFKLRDKPLISSTIYSTLLLGTGTLAFLLFLSRRQDKKVLYFSLLCFAIGWRRLLIDERILYMLGGFDWSILQLFENLTIYLSLPFFIGYFYYLFPQEVNKKLLYAGWLISMPFCLTAIVTEVRFYTQLNIPFQIIGCGLIPYIFYLYIQALRAKRTGAKMFGFSLLIFCLTAVNDALNYSYLIDTPNLMHLGALAFVLFQLSALIRRYLLNFRTIEQMSTELSQRNEELVQLDEFKDEFLATTSHELRTPLHGIAGLAERLSEDGSSFSDAQKHQIELIEATSRRLSNLVNDILDFSSIKHGKLKLNLQSIDLGQLTENVLQTLRPLIKGKQLTLYNELNNERIMVVADEYRLQQILFNLVGNAIKYTEQGHITVSAHVNGDTVTLDIEDTGAGIPQDKVAVLFHPFEQYLESGKRRGSSTGLGLSITKQLVNLHGGELKIDSEENKGTTVSFSLPICSEHQRVSLETENATLKRETEERKESLPELAKLQHEENSNSQLFNLPQGEHAVVFYADDEEVNRQLVVSQLEPAGYTVETFTCAKNLMTRLETTRPDLILMDLMMPGMNGIDACRQVRLEHNSQQLPVIMLTARYQISDIVEALGAGANDYLIKPYHRQELLARLFSQLSVKKFWQLTAENFALKQELTHSEQLQLELNKANTQLYKALEGAEESILMLNEEFDILFANQSFAKLCGTSIEELCKHTLSSLLSLQSMQQFQALCDQHNTHFEVQADFRSKEYPVKLYTTVHSDQFDTFLVILAKPAETDLKLDAPNLLESLTKELAASRSRIDQIENALNQSELLRPVAPKAEPEAEQKPAQNESAGESAKELVVRTLRTALLTWERYTHQTKADLAEKSRCWRVYIDGTTAKTRTLDKYLSLKTLPAKPRWRAVIKTANYVIDHCELNDEDQDELTRLIDAVDDAFS